MRRNNYVVESTLSDSYAFGLINQNMVITQRVGEAYTKGRVIQASAIQEQLLQIKRVRPSAIYDQVLKAFERGDVVLMYLDRKIKIPQSLPFIVIKDRNGPKAVIFVDNYGTLVDNVDVNGGEILNIPMKDLYALMEGAFLAWLYYDLAPTGNPFEKNVGLMRFTNSVYTEMVMRILNREYALAGMSDPALFNQVAFAVSRFYLERVWEVKNPAVIFNYAATVNVNMNKQSLLLIDDNYTNANIKTIEDLIKFIRTISPRLETLTMRYFAECFINSYKGPALFGMDTLPYFIFTLSCAYVGVFMINQATVSEIIKTAKGANIYYNELSKFM